MIRRYYETGRERSRLWFERMMPRVSAWKQKLFTQFGEGSAKNAVSTRLRDLIKRPQPPMQITEIQPPTLLVLMAGTTIEQYEQAGQLGRIAASLERHARLFRTVMLMSTDSTDYTELIGVERVKHVKMPLLVPRLLPGGIALSMSALVRFRTVRKASSVVILDEESAVSGWISKRLSGSGLSMSSDAPWAPPRHMSIEGKRRWLARAAMRRIDHFVQWPTGKSPHGIEESKALFLPELIDADLFCPLETTDPNRPRTVGVFIGSDDEADGRIVLGVAERLIRRQQTAVLQVFVTGHSAEPRASSLQSEASERGLPVSFQQLPRSEMLPDAIARLRLCIAFDGSEPVRGLLQAMASGVPGIAVQKKSEGETESPGWSRFVLPSGPTEEEISRNIETLFREPGVRLRMAREGRRFVIASHSLDALSAIETRHLLGDNPLETPLEIPEPEFDADAEAEKLAQMLEGLGVSRVATEDTGEAEVAA